MAKKMSLARGIYWIINTSWYISLIGLAMIVGVYGFFSWHDPSVVKHMVDESVLAVVGQFTSVSYVLYFDKMPFSIDPQHQSLLYLLGIATVFLGFITSLIMLYQMRKIFQNLIKGLYFPCDNVRRIGILAYLYILSSLIGMGLFMGIAHFFPEQIHLENGVRIVRYSILFALSKNWTPLFFGFILLIAKIFKEGHQLKEENELTV